MSEQPDAVREAMERLQRDVDLSAGKPQPYGNPPMRTDLVTMLGAYAMLAREVERLRDRIAAAERVIAELRDVLPLVEASGFYPGPLKAAVAAYDTPAPARTEE